MSIILRIIACLLLMVSQSYALENIDELEARSSRRGVNTWYRGNVAGNNYVFQPQTVIYQDTSTYHEIMILTQTDGRDSIGYGKLPEFNWQMWSADGKRIMYTAQLVDSDVGCFTPSWESYGIWLVARSDGTYLRPLCDSSNYSAVSARYPGWSPTVPDTYFQPNYGNPSGLENDTIYKNTVTDTSISYVEHTDTNLGVAISTPKGFVSGDGKLTTWEPRIADGQRSFVCVDSGGCNGESEGLVLTWADTPTLDHYWGANSGGDDSIWHDEQLTGTDSTKYWLYGKMPDDGYGDVWRYIPWDSTTTAPEHTTDNTCSSCPGDYDWWGGTTEQTEIQFLNSSTGTIPTGFDTNYWSHQAFDRWGTHIAYSDTDASPYGTAINDIDGDNQQVGKDNEVGYTQYQDWHGWTDYVWAIYGTTSAELQKYDSIADADHHTIFEPHSSTSGVFAKPSQSPDGTKATVCSDWLDDSDIYIGIAYYPYPPEITSVAAIGGTVTVKFNWQTGGTSRGYTDRGWPDEDADEPPPPRETEKFRLWRSSDKSTWTPLNTTDADIFSMYDFSDGTWESGYSNASVWEITDSPGNGTWYYIVSSIEWSGLESHALSNIFSITISSGSGTGSEDTAYPSSPGDLDNISASDIQTSFNTSDTSIIRHYNIYANDGSAPSIQQQDLIASISRNYCSGGSCYWVDWLGNTGGTTQYVVAAVDTQGNISDSSFVTNPASEHCGSADCSELTPEPTANGQYHISWDDMYDAVQEVTILHGISVEGVKLP